MAAREDAHARRRVALFHAANGCCEYCGRLLLLPFGTVDHRTPKALGGSNLRANLAWACLRCNRRKGIMTEAQFREALAGPGHRAGLTRPERRRTP